MTQSLRLLIIEDVEDDALLLTLELSNGGIDCEYLRVETVEELTVALKNGTWDAVFADYSLPSFTALDALRIVQDSGLDLPFIIVSGVIGEEQAVEALKAGAHDFILKGRYVRLVSALKRALKDAVLRHERKQTAEELSRYREHLEELVQLRTEDLAAANEELQAQSEELQAQSDQLISSLESLRRVEESLRAAHGKINTILEQMSDGFASFDHDWRYTYINSAAAKAFKMAPEQLLGKTIWEMWPPAHDLPLGVNFRRSHQENIPIQFEIFYPAPLDRWFECRCQPTTEGLAVFFSDITERKGAELERERLLASLEASNIELEAFNYSVAHDLRQPLNIIGMNCQAIKMICGDSFGKQCLGYVDGVCEGVLRMNRIIEALLNFSQMKHVEPRRDKVDLSALANEVATSLKQTAPERQIDFRIADGIVAVADPELLRSALENLLGNAWKYTSMREEAVIEFGATETDGKTVYFVRDNGAGFDNAETEKLFLPFRRLPGSEEFKGFGIGLATVERIIRRHGGRMCAEGESGKGATFYFTLS